MRAGSDPSTTTTTVKTGRELSSVAYQGSDAVFEMMDSVEFARMTLSDRWWTEGAGRGRREPAGRRVPRLPDGAPRTGSDPDRDGDVQNDRGVGRVASHWRRPGPHQGHRVCGRSVGAEQSAGLPARLRPDATVPIDSGAERHARRFPGCWRVGRRSLTGQCSAVRSCRRTPARRRSPRTGRQPAACVSSTVFGPRWRASGRRPR